MSDIKTVIKNAPDSGERDRRLSYPTSIKERAVGWLLLPKMVIVVDDDLSARAIEDKALHFIAALYQSYLNVAPLVMTIGSHVALMKLHRFLQTKMLVILIGERPGLIFSNLKVFKPSLHVFTMSLCFYT